MNNSCESDDECLAEFDICLGGALKDNIQLLQYPLRPSFRAYGDHGRLSLAEVAINSKEVPQAYSAKHEDMEEVQYVKEEANIRLKYQLDSESSNYDKNADEHRITEHTLVSEVVDLTRSGVDSTFASVEVAV